MSHDDIFSFEVEVNAKGRLLNIDYTNRDSVAEGRQPSIGGAHTGSTLVGDIGGFQDVTILTNGGTDGDGSESTSITLDTTRGIVPGMVVTGTGISGTVTIASITNDTVAVLNSAQTVANDVSMTFATNNPEVEVIDIQASRVDGIVKVQGILKIDELGATAEAHIYVEDFIKVT